MGEGGSVELRSVSDRIVFMDFAFRSIVERPILGVGIGNFPGAPAIIWSTRISTCAAITSTTCCSRWRRSWASSSWCWCWRRLCQA
ncbi:MAG: hypothetical protein U0703_21690 [Anaerolineae bacterium]